MLRPHNIKALLREPLLHFLMIGAGLFVLYGRVSPGDTDSRRIVVSQGQVDEMVRVFQSTWTRPPTSPEIRGLVESYVHDEIVYREGLAMGLDKDDTVIKRRVRQKYDLIAEEKEGGAPGEDDLLAYLKAHPQDFQRPSVVSLDQLFFDPVRTSPETVLAAKASLMKGADPAGFGQSSMLPSDLKNSAMDLVARDFGSNFAKEVGAAPIGQWVGPIVSAFGVHLIRVSARTEQALPQLDQVRGDVAREWESNQRARSAEENYRRVRPDYDVIIKARMP